MRNKIVPKSYSFFKHSENCIELFEVNVLLKNLFHSQELLYLVRICKSIKSFLCHRFHCKQLLNSWPSHEAYECLLFMSSVLLDMITWRKFSRNCALYELSGWACKRCTCYTSFFLSKNCGEKTHFEIFLDFFSSKVFSKALTMADRWIIFKRNFQDSFFE